MIVELPPGELDALLEWLEEYRADAWDHQIARDAESGPFEALRQRVREQPVAGQCRHCRVGAAMGAETMTIILRPETETRLRARAERDGQDISTLADALLTEVLTDDPDELTVEEAAEIRSGLRRGLEAAAAGQVKTLTQAVAEVRQRHGFPPSWASGVDGEG